MGLGYTVCSSMLMVTNKLALQAWPYPSLLMAVQFLSSAGVVRGLSLMGKLDVEPLVAAKVRAPCQRSRPRQPAPWNCPSVLSLKFAPLSSHSWEGELYGGVPEWWPQRRWRSGRRRGGANVVALCVNAGLRCNLQNETPSPIAPPRPQDGPF